MVIKKKKDTALLLVFVFLVLCIGYLVEFNRNLSSEEFYQKGLKFYNYTKVKCNEADYTYKITKKVLNSFSSLYFQKAIKLDNDFTEAYKKLIDLNYNSKKYKKVITVANELLAIDPTNNYGLKSKGYALYYLGEYEVAYQFCEEILKYQNYNIEILELKELIIKMKTYSLHIRD